MTRGCVRWIVISITVIHICHGKTVKDPESNTEDFTVLDLIWSLQAVFGLTDWLGACHMGAPGHSDWPIGCHMDLHGHSDWANPVTWICMATLISPSLVTWNCMAILIGQSPVIQICMTALIGQSHVTWICIGTLIGRTLSHGFA
jgi:hypothetical protein